MKTPAETTGQSSGSFSKTFDSPVNLGFGTSITSIHARRTGSTTFQGALHTVNQNLRPHRHVDIAWTAENQGSRWHFTHEKYGEKILSNAEMNTIAKRELWKWLSTMLPVTGIFSDTPAVTERKVEMFAKKRRTPSPVPARVVTLPPASTRAEPPSAVKPTRTMVQEKPSAPVVVSNAILPSETKLVRIPLHLIRPNPNQPRKEFNERDQTDLEASLEHDGQNTPIEVILDNGDAKSPYKIIKGERRWRGLIKLGETHAECLIRTREQIPNEVAEHMWCLIGDYHQTRYNKMDLVTAICYQHNVGKHTILELAAAFKMSIGWVEQHLQLGKLHPDLIKRLDRKLPRKEQMPMLIAAEIARVPRDKQLDIYEKVSRIKGCKLQAMEAARLSTAIVPRRKSNRTIRPGDLSRNMMAIVPRITADAQTIDNYDETVIKSLIIHRPAEAALFVRHLEDASKRLQEVKARIQAAQQSATATAST
jgi:ParB/RepB/Spo0J family partition protein